MNPTTPVTGVNGDIGTDQLDRARRAVDAAHAALPGWADGVHRARTLARAAEALRTSARLGALATADAVESAADRLLWCAGWADKLGGRPVGVVAIALPDAAPLGEAVDAVGPALAAGCPTLLLAADPVAAELGAVLAGVPLTLLPGVPAAAVARHALVAGLDGMLPVPQVAGPPGGDPTRPILPAGAGVHTRLRTWAPVVRVTRPGG